MNVSITYCAEWNYLPKAAGLADAIKDELGADVNLVSSGGGIFDVALDGEVVFSKSDVGRFPEHKEIIAAIRNKTG